MDEGNKKLLLFIGGIIWSMKSAKKAYAPPLNNNLFISQEQKNANKRCEEDFDSHIRMRSMQMDVKSPDFGSPLHQDTHIANCMLRAGYNVSCPVSTSLYESRCIRDENIDMMKKIGLTAPTKIKN